MPEFDVSDRMACEDLIAAYCHTIDLGNAADVASLFTDDGVWASEQVRMEGATAIRDAFGRRAAMRRTSAHICTNVLVTPEGPDAATGVCYFILYRHDGAEALAPLKGPAMVGTYRDRFVRTPDGWRFVERVAEARFTRREPR